MLRPNTLALVSLFGSKPSSENTHPRHDDKDQNRDSSADDTTKAVVQVHGMRIVQLTARTTSVMKVSEAGELSAFDPVLNAFRVLGRLYNLAVSGEVAVVPEDSYAESLTNRAAEESADLLILPWTETGSLSEAPMVSKNTVERKLRSDAYSSFITEAFDTATCATAVFVNKAFSGSLEQSPSALSRRMRREHVTELPTVDHSHHVFAPFFGGADGQAALRLVLQLAENPDITATMTHYQLKGEDTVIEETVSTKGILAEDKIHVSVPGEKSDDTFFVTMQRTLPEELRPRVTFRTSISYDPVQDAVADATTEVGQRENNGGDIIVLGRSTSMVDQPATCLGLIADCMLEKDLKASMVVVQAKRERIEPMIATLR